MNTQDIMKLAETYASEKSSEDHAGDFGPLCSSHGTRAALQAAIEALQGEVARLKTDGACWKQLHDEKVVERDALAAKLDELTKQEPVGYTDNTGIAFAVKWSGALPPNLTLYAAPKALEPVKFLVDATRFKTTMLANGRVLINDLPLELAGRWVAFVAAENDCHLKLAAPKALEEQEPREQRADWLPIANALDHAVRELGRTKEANAHDWNTAVHVFEFARATTCTCCNSHMRWPEAYRCLDCSAVLCEACAPAHFGPDHSKRAAEAHKKDMNSTIESPAHTLTEYFKEVQDRVVSTSTLTHEDIDTIVDPYQLWDVYEDAVGEDLRQYSKNNKEQSREVAALFFELGRQAAPKALEPHEDTKRLDALEASNVGKNMWIVARGKDSFTVALKSPYGNCLTRRTLREAIDAATAAHGITKGTPT